MSTLKLTKNIDKRRKKDYYLELSEISSKLKKIRETKKVRKVKFSNIILLEGIIGVWLISLVSLMIFNQFDAFYLIPFTMFLFLFLIFLLGIVGINRNVRQGENHKGERILTIDKDKQTSSIDNAALTTNWEEDDFIIIGHYAIVIIKKEGIGQALPIEYKDEYLDVLKKEQVNIKVYEDGVEVK